MVQIFSGEMCPPAVAADPFRQQERDFHDFSVSYCERRRAGLSVGQIIIPLLEDMPGHELMPDEAIISGATSVQLKLDVSKRAEGEYTWQLNSMNRYSRILRSLAINNNGVRGRMEVQLPNSHLRNQEWKRRRDLVWANDKMTNKMKTVAPDPEGLTVHALDRVVLGYLMRITQRLASRPMTRQNGKDLVGTRTATAV